MNTKTITKSLILSHKQCAKRAWLEAHHGAEPVLGMADAAMLEQGHMVHESARSLFAGAVRMRSDLVLADAAVQTGLELVSGADTVLEAAFVSGSLGVRVDVLQRGKTGYRVIEIKSAGEIKEDHLDDCAIQLACLEGAGLKVESVEIMHPSTARVRPVGGTGAEVFVTESVFDVAFWRAKQVGAWVSACSSTLAGAVPDVAPGDQCSSPNPCPFAAHCGKPVDNLDPDLVQYLPSKAKEVKELINAGIKRISDMPHGAMVHERNALVWEAIVQKRAIVRADIADSIRDLAYPRFYVDFEAAAFAVPIFEGMRAFQAIPFQFSCHRQDVAGAVLAHTEFLDVSGNDPRRGFVEALLADVGKFGPVLVYSSYEKTRLKELALIYDDLRDDIMALVERIVDLLPLARRGYYHPQMRGSWSLKKIAPTLPPCPELQAYSEMGEIADGLAAQAAYMEQINAAVVGPQKLAHKAKMLEYCKTDTRGLVHFVDCMEAAYTPVSQARSDILAMA
jgi:hypothetical protein